jgi:hypothetical protein
LSPTPVSSNTERYITETRTVNNNELVPIRAKSPQYNEVVRVENATGPEVIPTDIHLSGDILPRPKTKVTTTIRTYTYEIPDDGLPSSTIVTRADRDPPKNTAMYYKTERNERNVNYQPNQSSPTQNYNNYPPLTIQEVGTVYPYISLYHTQTLQLFSKFSFCPSIE